MNESFPQHVHLKAPRQRRGVATIFALFFIISASILFQAYTRYSIQDFTVMEDLLTFQDLHSLRVSCENAVANMLVVHFENDRMPSHDNNPYTVIQGELDQLNESGISFHLLTSGDNPASSLADSSINSFWPDVALGGTAGNLFLSSTALDGNFALVPQLNEFASAGLRRVDSFLRVTGTAPTSLPFSALRIQNNALGSDPEVFRFPIERRVNGTPSHLFTVDIRMWQVPVADFNLVAFALPTFVEMNPGDDPIGLIIDPPVAPAITSAMQTGLSDGTLRGLAVSGNYTHGNGDPYWVDQYEFPAYFANPMIGGGSRVWDYLFRYTGYYHRLAMLPVNGIFHVDLEANYNQGDWSNGFVYLDLDTDEEFLTDTDPIFDAVATLDDVANTWTIDLSDLPDNPSSGFAYRAYITYDMEQNKTSLQGPDNSLIITQSGSPAADPLIIIVSGRAIGELDTRPTIPVTIDGDISSPIALILLDTTTTLANPGPDNDLLINGCLYFYRFDFDNANPSGGIEPDSTSFTVNWSLAWYGADLELNSDIQRATVPGTMDNDTLMIFRALLPRYFILDADSTFSLAPAL